MLARPVYYLNRSVEYLKAIHLQRYINVMLVAIGLAANIVTLIQYFGLIYTPPTNSNFYVNSREFLAWSLIAMVYSVGFLNAVFRRRWRRLYGDARADHSVFNFFAKIEDSYIREKKEKARIRFRNFQRDFSLLYLFTLIFTFVFSRAISATENATGLTPSPWGDILLAAFINIFVVLGMMVVTSMFDFAMSIFLGDQHPEELP